MSLVPAEFQGLARRLLQRFAADEAALTQELSGPFEPLYQAFLGGDEIRPKQLIELCRLWPRLPRHGVTLGRSHQRKGRHVTLTERRLSARPLRFKGWEPGAEERSVALVEVVFTIAPGAFETTLRPIALVGMHALARRFERGLPADDAAVIADVIQMGSAAQAIARLGGEFRTAVASGVWVGDIGDMRGDRVAVVRTFIPGDP